MRINGFGRGALSVALIYVVWLAATFIAEWMNPGSCAWVAPEWCAVGIVILGTAMLGVYGVIQAIRTGSFDQFALGWLVALPVFFLLVRFGFWLFEAVFSSTPLGVDCGI